MASGGYRPNKSGKSEPKRRSNWQQSVSSDRDDVQSLNSLHSDMRINNWDLSDLFPSNLGGGSKHRKKSKGNPEREREQSLSLDSPPHDKKHYKTSKYPHTRITPSSLTSQRVALEHLKQHMTFSDLDDQISTDGERNNERQMSHTQSGRRLHNASFARTDSEDDVRGTRDRHINRNNNMDYSSREHGPDSNEIVAHLMQIRDFTKQAKSMLESMEKLGDRKKAEDIEKVRRLIINLQEQEQGYRGLLQNTMTHRDDDDDEAAGGEDDAAMKMEVKYDSDDDDDDDVDLEVRTLESETTEENSQDSRPRIESKLGIGSDDNDAEGEEDQYREPVRGATGNSSDKANSSKAADLENVLIQGQLGLSGGPVKESEAGSRGPTVIDREVPPPHHQQLLHILREKQEQLQALMSRQEELNLRRRETEKKLLEAQTRDNKARAALVAVTSGRQVLEQRLVAHQSLARGTELGAGAWDMNRDEDEGGAAGEDRQLKSNIVGYPESDDEDNSKVCEVESLPNELLELKRQLNYLRNEFSQVSEAPKNVESETRPLTDGREQLQNKLLELQNKKSRMDLLLQELQRLHSQPLDNLRNNETNQQASNVQPPTPTASNIPSARHQSQQKLPVVLPNVSTSTGQSTNQQARVNEMTAAAQISVDNSGLSYAHLPRETTTEPEPGDVDPVLVQEMQEKLRHLKEVRGQLDQLRSLVQYYQGQKGDMEALADRASSPTFNESALRTQASAEVRGSQSALQQQQVQEMLRLHTQQRQQQLRHGKDGAANSSSSLHNMVQLPNLAGTDQGGELSDEDNASVSHTESQWSHLGPWDDDPEIQEKVRKLRAAKEKLRQLQDLVAFVQQSPDAAGTLPENMGDLTASVEGEAVSHATQTDDLNVSISEGEVPSETRRIPQKDELNGLDNPRTELMRLRKERSMLLEIQNQLKDMHNQASETQGREVQKRTEQNSDMEKPELEQVPSATVVTFASNDELYSKMRRQRILREELRSKKKELEAIMKKDRNKRQYSRNQDNQSDTVSLNTDAFGIAASVDATMATWGGSTVDNLENITEDEDGQERNDHNNDEDDGYPSDGIVQAEEEEEANDSDDGTYTIERDARQRKNLRKGANIDLGARPKTSRGRQTYPQPNYREKNTKKMTRKENKDRNTQNQRDGRARQEQDFMPSPEQRQEELFIGQNYEWLRSIEDKLSSLSSAVENLLTKSEVEGRQLSVSLSQENALQSGRLLSPMQEQMLQLQNQSMMLSFGQLVQSLSHQQGDIQQLQQQMQALQLQVQELHHEHGFPVGSTAGVVHPHFIHPALANPALSSSTYNLQTAPVGTHTLTLNHQQMASPYSQSNLNNTGTSGMFELSAVSPSLRNFQPNSLGLSASSLSLGLDRRTAGGASGLGNSLSVNTGSSLSLPQQGPGFAFSSTGQSTSNLVHSQHHQASQTGSSVTTMTKDFNQIVNTLHTTPPAPDNMYGEFRNLLGSGNQQSLTNRISFLPSQVTENEDIDNESSRKNSYLIFNMNKNRKSGLKVKKSESDPASGGKMSTPKVERFEGRKDGGNMDLSRWEREPAADYRPVSGGAANFSEGSSSSSIQFMQDIHSRLKRELTQAKSTGASAESNSLFDTLRDAIYKEVASVISQNENRPQFLLELFRDMRQIDSDFMRQRTLYSLQELLRSNLKGSRTVTPSSNSWSKATPNTVDTANSEQTPSESVTSEDDEDLKVTRLQEEIAAVERSRLERMNRNGTFRNFPYDYAEPVNNASSLSTPTNGGEEFPFFQDALGETVIEFDGLKREVETERHSPLGDLGKGSHRNQNADKKKGQKFGQAGFLMSEQLLKDLKKTRSRGKRRTRGAVGGEKGTRSQGSQRSDMTSSTAVDQGSESSVSELPYAQIDMKQLDQQIKDIMMKTIPVVKDHMEEVCSSQLLGYFKRLVLSLTDQMGNQEFVRFFQHQLASILDETLQKYEGRKMRDCGEDLLVEISDVLFNELAFFRLMQDLDDPNVVRKIRSAEWPSGALKDENSSEYATSSSTSGGFDEDNNDGDKNKDGGTDKTQEDNDTRRELRITDSEQDELGRDRDDEMAIEIGFKDVEEKDDDESEQPYKIELAPSETKPFTRIGSDEDDDERDEVQSVDDPSETAVSRDALLEINGLSQPAVPLSTRPETEGAHGDGAEKQDLEKPVSPKKVVQITALKPQGDGDSAEALSTNISAVTTEPLQMNGSVNGGNNNGSDEELTVNDLPERLTIQPASSPSVVNNNIAS